MLKKSKVLAMLLMAAFLAIGSMCQAADTSVTLVPDSLNVAPGSDVNVSVYMSIVPPGITMSAISARILYDPSVFTYDDTKVVIKGDLLTHNWDLLGGTPLLGELRVGGIDGDFSENLAAGSGNLFTFTLKAKEDAPMGSSALTWGVYDGYDNALAGFDYGDADFNDIILAESALFGASIKVFTPTCAEHRNCPEGFGCVEGTCVEEAPPVIGDGPWLAEGYWPVLPTSPSNDFVLDENYFVLWTFSDDYATCAGLCTNRAKYRRLDGTQWFELQATTDRTGKKYAFVELPVNNMRDGSYVFQMEVVDCAGQIT